MRTLRILALVAVVAASFSVAQQAEAGWPRARAQYLSQRYASAEPWHGDYYHTSWGRPVALVVPPNAKMMSSYGWGVTATEITPIYHQFGRGYPGSMESGMILRPTPAWPSHTDQFGVYPVRGPW